MAEESFPIVEQPLSAEQWRSVTLGIGNGVLDEGGSPFRLTQITNASNTVRVNPETGTGYAHAILRGFYYKIDEAKTLSIPPVTSATTYWIALQYSPVRAEEKQAPIILDVFTSLDRSQGKDYLVLHRIERRPDQLLTDAVFTKMDTKVSPSLTVDSYEAMPDAAKVLWGTKVLVTDTANEYRAGGSSGSPQWIATNNRRFSWDTKSDSGTYTNPGSGYRRALGRRGVDRRLRGRVSLVSGNDFMPGQQYNVMSTGIPAEDAPSASMAFATQIGGITTTGDARVARVEVAPDGSVTAYVSTRTAWISLDGCEWEAKS